jgi:multimeric flavodoxin WrbA
VRSDEEPCAERPAHRSRVLQPARQRARARSRRGGGSRVGKGVEVRRRHVAELNHKLLISAKRYWRRHRSETKHEPDARPEDIEWADGIAVGTPTRFRNASAQPELFLEFTASYTRTSVVRGIFRKTAEARAAALELLPAA